MSPRIGSTSPGMEWAKHVLESAFRPLRCQVAPDAQETGFAVLVYQEQSLVYSISFINQGELTAAWTRDIIQQARGVIVSRGYTLEPWIFPGLRAV